MEYLYETHLHTEQGSKCGKAPGRDYIARYRDLGYAGIMVTDHFYNGNCRPGRELPWREWVEQYCRGYEEALEEGDRQGLQVFFGLEERFHWDEWLVYGLDKAFLLAHPDMRVWSRGQWLRETHAAGGCIVQAHPFRRRRMITSLRSCLGVDGVEICNAGNREEDDALAARYAQRLGAFVSAGSDIHWPDHREDGGKMGVIFNRRLESALDYARAVRAREAHTLRVPEGRGLPAAETPAEFDRPLVVYGRAGEKTALRCADLF